MKGSERHIYVTGDTHGSQAAIKELIDFMEQMRKAEDNSDQRHSEETREDEHITCEPKDPDILIITGDFGAGLFDDEHRSEKSFFDEIAEKEILILFCDGNHENHDELNALPVKEWCGGKVHMLRPNIIHLMRGEVYIIDGETIFAFGGGYSMDLGFNPFRVPGVAYWKEEMPSEEEYENGRINLQKAGCKIDYVITHTFPVDSKGMLGGIKDLPEERPLTYYLQHDVFDALSDQESFVKEPAYKRWYFGHLHIDKEIWRRQYAVLKYVRDLRTGEIVFTRTKFAGA